MKHRLGFFALALGLLAGGPAVAQYDDSDTTSVLPSRNWYASPMFSFSRVDPDRGTHDAYGGTLSFGKKLTSGLALELTGSYQTAAVRGGGDKNSLYGGGLTALLFPFAGAPNFYGLVSLMYGHGHKVPGAVSDYNSTVFDIGAGYLYSITPWMALRAEARYRTDQHDEKTAGVRPGESAFTDGLLNVGLMFPFGVEPPPPPAEPEPEVVETVAVAAELDSDGDGVPDSRDQCPDTPAGVAVNDVGCPLDSDGDGVPDAEDECPNTPPGANVLANGCALQGDCRKPRPGEQVDENGCAAQTFVLRGVKFEFDSDRLTPDARNTLNEVAGTLQAYPSVNVDVQGHTDNIGTDAYNLGLSERRANSVKDYLEEQGVDGSRMTPVGYGATQPIADNNSEEGREENRRVELSVTE
ncbi:OmpA family protein [Sinimarinibacterium sp. NLF-5-8]|uniref:OmpA family protein n=1 Tax=Sinimarinibacterium sp. NLF-5-8 TaxID=2698684 RepID=UPI001EE3AB4D|nr:OmpA family protein [Sinimarinibacterium sp. NLF-5-8]